MIGDVRVIRGTCCREAAQREALLAYEWLGCCGSYTAALSLVALVECMGYGRSSVKYGLLYSATSFALQ